MTTTDHRTRIQLATAPLPDNVPAMIGTEDGLTVLVLDETQMDALPWGERLPIINTLLRGEIR